MNQDYINFVTLNKDAIASSTECVCLYCLKILKPEEIIDFCYDIDKLTGKKVKKTAICPYCQIDSILPNSLINYDEKLLKTWHDLAWN